MEIWSPALECTCPVLDTAYYFIPFQECNFGVPDRRVDGGGGAGGNGGGSEFVFAMRTSVSHVIEILA